MSMSKRPDKTFIDGEVISIFWDIDNGGPFVELSMSFLRPAYQYTKAEVGGIRHEVSNV